MNSSSWRPVTPLRIVGYVAESAFRLANATNSKSKEKTKLLLAHGALYVNHRPKLRRIMFAVLALFPALEGYIKRAMTTASSMQIAHPVVATELANLTPRARSIYQDLKAAIGQTKGE